jgi:hypothetical protein
VFGDVTFAQAPFASLGGNSFFRTIEEAAAASGVFIVESVRGGLITESSTAAAAVSNFGNFMFATEAESATATAAQTPIAAVYAAIAELANGTATVTVTSAVNGAVVEGVTASSATTIATAFLAAIAESSTGADSYVGSKVWYKTMEESAAGSATQITSLAALARLSETVTALDSLSVIKTLHANVTGVQLYVNIGNVLIWVVIDDSQDPNWQNIPT